MFKKDMFTYPEKIYIKYNKNNMPFSIQAYAIEDWLYNTGVEIVRYKDFSEIENKLDKTIPVIGPIAEVLLSLEKLGLKKPDSLEMPDCLMSFAKRKIWTSTLQEIHVKEEMWPVFIKPLKKHKLFTGHVISNFTDLYKTAGCEPETEILVSEVVKFQSEYRCFILNKNILDMRRYAGNINWYPDIKTIENIVACFENQPVAYSVDVGSINGNTVLVEVNDSYSLGAYGLSGFLQAKMTISRWKEMVS